MKITSRISKWSVLGLAAVCLSNQVTYAADAQQEKKLIAVLQSDASGGEKGIACKKLAVYGTKEAVPALAALLPDPKLTSWARIALEAIPDPAAGDALREALGKVQGRILVGVINSIGVRADAQSANSLIQKLTDADVEVACAAAEALGHIGGETAIKALTDALKTTSLPVLRSVATGCILSAEKLMASGKSAEAAQVYDTVRAAKVPKQKILEATRGAILARGAGGVGLLIDQLKSTDKGEFGMALRTARELPGQSVTEALVVEIDKATADRQLMLVLAVADRNDPAVRPKLLELAKSGRTELKTTVIGVLDRFADVSCVPVFLDAAIDNDPELSKTAKSALARVGGKEVDADLLARLPQSSGKTRETIIQLAKLRKIDAALPAVVQSAGDADPGVRRAALETIAVLGSDQQVPDLVRLLGKTQSAKDRDDIETALMSICSSSGARSLPQVMPLAKSTEPSQKIIGLHCLASIGGPQALNTVKAAINDADQSVQKEAVSILSTWPNKWPEDSAVAEPLLQLAKSGTTTSYQLQGLRGYLLYVQEDKNLDNNAKVSKVRDIMPLIKTPDQKRQLISVISTFAPGAALDLLVGYADDSVVAEEACLSIVNVASARTARNVSKDLRRKALQTASEKSKNEDTRKKAQDALTKI